MIGKAYYRSSKQRDICHKDNYKWRHDWLLEGWLKGRSRTNSKEMYFSRQSYRWREGGAGSFLLLLHFSPPSTPSILCQIASHKPKLLPHAPTGDLRLWQPSQSAAPWSQLKAVLARLRLAASNQSVRGLPWKEGHAWLRELPRLPMSAQRGVQVAQREAARGVRVDEGRLTVI